MDPDPEILDPAGSGSQPDPDILDPAGSGSQPDPQFLDPDPYRIHKIYRISGRIRIRIWIRFTPNFDASINLFKSVTSLLFISDI